MNRAQPDHGACGLCEREAIALTRHHLIPRTRHRGRRNKREFGRREVRERILMLCTDCHRQVHAVLSEKELEREFNTPELLLEHPQVERFVRWLRGRRVSSKIRVRAPRS